ncbi:tetratricopeptide repeat protein [Oceanobacillus piezotolerans]|uniref:Tetratricopeptide repeat protein n=1 Tax=Oceanobacillus piezotolerans TaxID=2448030 RepID=A0A498DBG5_9BACI|nr:tetratricopeptide repeat protein [Oceanobacillus piezotolerans]RLL46908.1 tetratricopeptide repeat protein [Oceanobacillus piezotolerans]
MPIKPNFQIGKKKKFFTPTKKFTDREEPRKVFRDTLNRMKQSSNDTYEVIMYYGVGGIGKTSLQNQLKQELLEFEPNALYTKADFKDITLHTPARALLELVREIQFRQRVSFPHFEIAYSIYFYKRNPDISYNEKKLPFEKELGIMASIVSTMDGMGIAGTVTGIVGKLYDSKKNWNLNKEVKAHLKELENDSVQEIEEKLIAFFAYDLQQAIAKHRIPNAVIFLDTFEALWSGLKNKATIHTKDKWIRDLVASLPNVLFVICGREYLRWEQYDAEWKEIVHHQRIANFENVHADEFLMKCGVEETDIREKIINSSHGYPYHLDLSVNTYFEMKNRGEHLQASRFGSNHREILDRFLEYLTDDEIETLKIMSIPRFYDQEIFAYLLTKHPTGYAITKYEDFNSFSFITSDEEKRFIHSMMRQGILDYTSKELVKSVHQTMAVYYEEKSSLYAKVHQEKEMEALTERMYHQKESHEQLTYIQWLSGEFYQTLKRLQQRGESRFLRDALSILYEELGAKKLGISLVEILVDMVHLNGEYDRAISMIDALFEGQSKEEILASQQATHLFIRKVHHQMFFMPVSPLIQDLLEIEPILAGKKWQKEYNELLFMLGGNLGVLWGDPQFSRKWLVKAIRYAEEHQQHSYQCRAIRKYVDILKLNGHLKWAEDFCKKGIHIAKENGYERYEAILVCTLADIYRMNRQHELAESYLEKAHQMIQKVGIKSWIGHIHATYAELFFQQCQYEEAMNQWQEAIAIYDDIGQKWGQIIAAVGMERCQLKGAIIENPRPLQAWKKVAEDCNYQREVKLINKTIQGETDIFAMPYL